MKNNPILNTRKVAENNQFNLVNEGYLDTRAIELAAEYNLDGLYFKGDLSTLELPSCAIVGARLASQDSFDLGMDIAKKLSHQGYAIVSGLARGVDASAHQGCLYAKGKTIAVLAHGLERIYPAEHQRLASQISRQGLLISEYPEQSILRRMNFVSRNRIIVLLAEFLIVIQVAKASGSLTTAEYCLNMGKKLYVYMPRVYSKAFFGSKELLEMGGIGFSELSQLLEILKNPLK